MMKNDILEEKTMLVIDDDPMYLDAFVSWLKFQDILVTSFCNCLEALEYYKKDSSVWDVIISDIQVPKMDGIEFAIEILKLNPKQPIVLASGDMASYENKINNLLPKSILKLKKGQNLDIIRGIIISALPPLIAD